MVKLYEKGYGKDVVGIVLEVINLGNFLIIFYVCLIFLMINLIKIKKNLFVFGFDLVINLFFCSKGFSF